MRLVDARSLYTLADLYDADLRTRSVSAFRLARDLRVPHPLNNVQYADGISLCRHAKRCRKWQLCRQEVQT